MHKQCNKCGVDLIVGENANIKNYNNSDYRCKECIIKTSLKWVKNNYEQFRKKTDNYYNTPSGRIISKKSMHKTKFKVKAGVYGIFSDCKLIYIGESKAPNKRKFTHFSKMKCLKQAKIQSNICYALSVGDLQRDKLRFKMFKFIDDTSTRKQQEALLIQRYKPLYNEVYV